MKSIREKVLRISKSFYYSSINDLAKAEGINTISYMHHLTANDDTYNRTCFSCPNYHIAHDHTVISAIDKTIKQKFVGEDNEIETRIPRSPVGCVFSISN
jgi:hypothetical protein